MKSEATFSIRPAIPGRRTLEVRITVQVREDPARTGENLSQHAYDAIREFCKWEEVRLGSAGQGEMFFVPLDDGRVAVVKHEYDNFYGNVRDTEVLR